MTLEFRQPTCDNDRVLRLAKQYQHTIVLQDIQASASLLISPMRSGLSAFSWPAGRCQGSYPDDVLQEYSGYIREWQEEGRADYVCFNNTIGDAVQNLATLNAFIPAMRS
jgi:uncharacterized protein YecE (DUF72 family)